MTLPPRPIALRLGLHDARAGWDDDDLAGLTVTVAYLVQAAASGTGDSGDGLTLHRIVQADASCTTGIVHIYVCIRVNRYLMEHRGRALLQHMLTQSGRRLIPWFVGNAPVCGFAEASVVVGYGLPIPAMPIGCL